jgi:diaminopimelate decarboxylase
MTFETTDFAKIAHDHGTPFYLYDMDAATEHARRLRARLPPFVDIFYCLKANANKRVLEYLRPYIDGLDISSGGELEIALAAGFDPRAMSFAGPGKTENELSAAVRDGIGIVSVESPGELRRLGSIARAKNKSVDITLRINPQSIPREFAMKMGGLPSQFGISEEDADVVIEEAKQTLGIRMRGIHVFAGTQCLDAPAIVENIRQTLGIANRIAHDHNLEVSVVNLGGGFGVPYFAGQEEMDHDALAAALTRTLCEVRADNPRFKETRFILELGRYLIAPFGVYVAKVLDLKETRGKRFVVLDGGMNHCFPATGNFGQLVKKNYPVKNLSKSTRDGESRSATASIEATDTIVHEIVGPLCTPIDSMARAIALPRVDVGDLVAFMSCGAYCYGASPLLFLSHPTPLELVVHEGICSVARVRRRAVEFE